MDMLQEIRISGFGSVSQTASISLVPGKIRDHPERVYGEGFVKSLRAKFLLCYDDAGKDDVLQALGHSLRTLRENRLEPVYAGSSPETGPKVGFVFTLDDGRPYEYMVKFSKNGDRPVGESLYTLRKGQRSREIVNTIDRDDRFMDKLSDCPSHMSMFALDKLFASRDYLSRIHIFNDLNIMSRATVDLDVQTRINSLLERLNVDLRLLFDLKDGSHSTSISIDADGPHLDGGYQKILFFIPSSDYRQCEYAKLSSGTKKLINVLVQLLVRCRGTEAAILCNLDRGLHPILAQRLYEIMVEEELFKQFISITDNYTLLSKSILRADEIAFIDHYEGFTGIIKNDPGSRSRTNDRKYLDGYFGGDGWNYL